MTFFLLFLALLLLLKLFRPTGPAAMLAVQVRCARQAERDAKLAR